MYSILLCIKNAEYNNLVLPTIYFTTYFEIVKAKFKKKFKIVNCNQFSIYLLVNMHNASQTYFNIKAYRFRQKTVMLKEYERNSCC